MIQTAIVGGGPAGAQCAYCLTENNIYPTIFDHTHPREKACGGLITKTAQNLFPFLKQIPIEHTEIKQINYILPSGKRISLKGNHLGFSRLTLDEFLVNRAVEKGAELIKEKVIGLKRKGNFWYLKTANQTYVARVLIGADGVNSLVRRELIGPLMKKDLGLCFGYFAHGSENENVTIVFSPYHEGYLWMIPRGRNISLGIGVTKIIDSCKMKKELDLFIKKSFPNIEKISSWTALIPNIKDPGVFCKPLAGKNWILVGDAAGHVDPISGEGIMYALLDGKLAAKAIVQNSPKLFDILWKERYRKQMVSAIKMRKWLYKKPILELYFQTQIFLDAHIN